MTVLPRVDIHQTDLPGSDGSASFLVVHMCTDRNFSQRLTVARRLTVSGRARHHDIQLTKAQVLELIDLLIDRVDIMADDIPLPIRR